MTAALHGNLRRGAKRAPDGRARFAYESGLAYRPAPQIGSTFVFIRKSLWSAGERTGALLLQPGQHRYSVLSASFYGRVKLFEDHIVDTSTATNTTRLSSSRNDSRIDAGRRTFEGYSATGKFSRQDARRDNRCGSSYIAQIKERNLG